MNSSPLDLYDVLGVPPDAALVAIRRAYWQQLKRIHPDRQASWRADAPRLIAPLLGLPMFEHIELPRLAITTSHPDGYLWKRDFVDGWLGQAPAAWIDDDFTDLDHQWADERTQAGCPTPAG